MTQNEKDLLLKDLCTRLPYNTKFRFEYVNSFGRTAYSTNIITGIRFPNYIEYHSLTGTDYLHIEKNVVKPYLFPLSSMSEDQKYEFYLRFIVNDCDFDCFKIYLDNGKWHKLLTSLDDIEAIIDWFHKNYIDYRGLIPMGLAEDATGLNIY